MAGNNEFCAKPKCPGLVVVAGALCTKCECSCGQRFQRRYDETADTLMKVCFACRSAEPVLERVL